MVVNPRVEGRRSKLATGQQTYTLESLKPCTDALPTASLCEWSVAYLSTPCSTMNDRSLRGSAKAIECRKRRQRWSGTAGKPRRVDLVLDAWGATAADPDPKRWSVRCACCAAGCVARVCSTRRAHHGQFGSTAIREVGTMITSAIGGPAQKPTQVGEIAFSQPRSTRGAPTFADESANSGGCRPSNR